MATQRPHVPQFGKWEGDDNVPYTVYFDKARQDRGGKMMNPNDPRANPEAFGNFAPPAPPGGIRTEYDEPVKHVPAHERKTSREDNQRNQVGDGIKRPTRDSVGSEHSIDRSPLHPRHQAKITGRGNGSPDGKGSTGHGTPGRSRIGGQEDGFEKGAAIPKFGEWDEENPASADGFTQVFNQVREERHNGTTPNITTENHNYGRSNHKNGHQKPKNCCFPWNK